MLNLQKKKQYMYAEENMIKIKIFGHQSISSLKNVVYMIPDQF